MSAGLPWLSCLGGCRAPAALSKPDHMQSEHTLPEPMCSTGKYVLGPSEPPSLARPALGAAWALLLSAYLASEEVVFVAQLQDSGYPDHTVSFAPHVDIVRYTTCPDLILALDQQFRDAQASRVRHVNNEFTNPRGTLLRIINLTDEASHPRHKTSLLGGVVDFLATDNRGPQLQVVVDCTVIGRRITVRIRTTVHGRGDSFADSLRNQYLHLLQQLLRNGSTPVAKLDLLCDADKRTLRSRSQQHAPPPYRDACLHGDISAYARANPLAPAVCAWDGDMTYSKLDSLARRSAWLMLQRGVLRQIGDVVPICFDKSKWAIVTILAVSLAGGTCVMLDPRYPETRVQHILQETGAGLVIGSRNHRHVWPGAFVAIDETFLEAAEKEDEGPCASPTGPSLRTPLLPAVPGSALFCVVFTSGSTGTPKACALEHAAFASMAAPFARAARLGPQSRVLHVAPYSFVGGLAEVVLALAAGACLCVPSPEPSYLGRFPNILRDMAVNWADITSGVAELLDPVDAPGLVTLLLSGEMATRRAIEMWAEINGVTLLISYGATESCSAFAVSEAPLRRSTSPGRVGMPFSGRAWIVDPVDGQRLLPDGAIGELVLEGHGLGREYLNDTARTQLVFHGSSPPWRKGAVLDTSDSWHGCRLYKSGDLAFFGPDGAIHLTGRKDTQAKLRGQRIELGEVEYHIRHLIPGHASIAEVIRPRDFPNDVLVAFVPSQAEETKRNHQSLQETRRMIAERMNIVMAQLRGLLPAYMVPSAFLAIEDMPLTRSGKIDRKGLRDISESLSAESLFGMSAPSGPPDAHQSNNVRLSPRPMEHRLHKLWERTFERDLNGATLNFNFFRIGGDSLLAAKLSSLALRDGIKLSFADVLGHPTLHKQAQVASIIHRPASRTQGLVEGSSSSACTEENIRYATDFQASILAGELTWRASEVHFFTLNFDPPLSLDRLRSALLSFVNHHTTLRTAFKIDGQRVYQMVLDTVPVGTVLSIVAWDRRKTAKPKVKRGPQIIRSGTLVYPLHFTLFKDTRERQGIYRLVFRISHTLFDGPIFTRFCTELRLLLSEKPLPEYYPYASLMEPFTIRRATGVEYWRSLLSKAKPTQLINRAHHPIYDAADSIVRHTVTFPDMKNADVSLSTMLNSAWAITLSQLLNQRDVLFGVYVAMRNLASAEARHTLGCTLAVLPMRANIACERASPGTFKIGSHRTVPQSLHAQFVASLHHVAATVHGPSRPRLSTLLLHKNEAEVREEEQEKMPFCVESGGPGLCSRTTTCQGSAADAVGGYGDDLEVLTLPDIRAGTLTLEAYFCSRVLPEKTVKEVLYLFGRNLDLLVRGQQDCVSVVASTTVPESLRGVFPLQAARALCARAPVVERAFPPVPADHLVEAVVDAWNAVFKDCRHDESADCHRYDNGRPPEDWHPIAAFSLAQRYRELGCSVSVDDVLEDMSISGHVAFLEKKGCPRLRRGKSVCGVVSRPNE